VFTVATQTHNMANLDMLLLRGPSLADTEEGLNELRYTILTKGIPANSEGMVSMHPIHPQQLLHTAPRTNHHHPSRTCASTSG
jgi:hypothetical protein